MVFWYGEGFLDQISGRSRHGLGSQDPGWHGTGERTSASASGYSMQGAKNGTKGCFKMAKVGRPSSNVATRRQLSKYSAPTARGFLQVWTPTYAMVAVLLLLAISAWAKGLFFNYSALLVAGFVLAALGFLAGWLDRKALYLLLPWAVAALGYTIALTHAVDIGTAEQGAFLHWTLVAMAAGALVMAKDAILSRRFLGLIGYLTAILAFAIPLTTGHWVTVPGAIFAPDRWSTIFEYPDTAGAVFGAGFLGLVFLRPPTAWERWLKRGAAIVDGAGLILSLSRGADLIMPFALIGGILVVAERGMWTKILNELMGAGVGGLLLSFLWRGALPSNHLGPLIFLGLTAVFVVLWEGFSWLWNRLSPTAVQSWAAGGIAVVIVLAGLGVYVNHKSKEPVDATTAKPYAISTSQPLIGGELRIAVSGTATVLLQAESRYDNPTTLVQKTVKSTASIHIPALGTGNQALTVTVTPVTGTISVTRLTMQSTGAKAATVNLVPWFVHVMPESIYSRIVEVSGRQLGIWERGIFVSNGLKMAEKNPIWGYGAGGWAADYRVFQTLPYTSREVHNGWVQWWVDGGMLAGLGYAALMAGVIYGIWRSRRLEKEARWAAAGLAAVTVALLGHSLVDWDLSFFWDELFLAATWSAFIGLSLTAQSPEVVREKKSWPLWTAAVISVGMALFTFNLAQAQGYLQAANNQAASKKSDASVLATVDVAVSDQPNLGNAQDLKAELLASLSTQSKSGYDFSEANQAYQRALALLPTSASAYAAYGNYLVDAKQYSLALTEFMKAIQLGPMRAVSLDPAWEGLYNVAVAGLTDGNRALTEASARDLRTAFADYAKTQASIPQGMIPSLQLPAPTGADQLAQGLSFLMANQQKAAAKTFTTVTPSSLATTGHEWVEIMALAKEPKFWKDAGLLGTVAKNLVDWGMVVK